MKRCIKVIVMLCMFQPNIYAQQSLDCSTLALEEPLKVNVTTFRTSAPNLMASDANEFVKGLKDNLFTLTCLEVGNVLKNQVSDGLSAIITGNIKDYFKSEAQLGNPRIAFEVEIRNPVNQKIMVSSSFEFKGKLYPGIGRNRSFENMIGESYGAVNDFVLKNLPLIASTAKAETEKVQIAGQVVELEDRVHTSITTGTMYEHADRMRERNHLLNMGIEEYYNDPAWREELSDKYGSTYFIYSINGKTYEWSEKPRGIQDPFRLMGITTSPYHTENGLEIIIRNSAGEHNKIDMFHPKDYPKYRRFHFGNNEEYVDGIPSTKNDFTSFLINLSEEPQINKLNIYYPSDKQYTIKVSNNPTKQKDANVESGFVQILEYQPGRGGMMEIYFKLKTTKFLDSKGREVGPLDVEGRFRVRQ